MAGFDIFMNQEQQEKLQNDMPLFKEISIDFDTGEFVIQMEILLFLRERKL